MASEEEVLINEIKNLFNQKLNHRDLLTRINWVTEAVSLKSCKNCQNLVLDRLPLELLQMLSISSTNQHKKYRFMVLYAAEIAELCDYANCISFISSRESHPNKHVMVTAGIYVSHNCSDAALKAGGSAKWGRKWREIIYHHEACNGQVQINLLSGVDEQARELSLVRHLPFVFAGSCCDDASTVEDDDDDDKHSPARRLIRLPRRYETVLTEPVIQAPPKTGKKINATRKQHKTLIDDDDAVGVDNDEEEKAAAAELKRKLDAEVDCNFNFNDPSYNPRRSSRAVRKRLEGHLDDITGIALLSRELSSREILSGDLFSDSVGTDGQSQTMEYRMNSFGTQSSFTSQANRIVPPVGQQQPSFFQNIMANKLGKTFIK